MAGISDVVMFGIRSGMKLARQGRLAYVEATQNHELTLPLPNFDPTTSASAARAYFRGGGRKHLTRDGVAKSLFEKAESGTRLEEEEKNELIRAFVEAQLIDQIETGQTTGLEAGLDKESLRSLVTVRQWARNNTPSPPAAQRLAGTLVEIGVDYFISMPASIDENSARGRAVSGFLNSLDNLDFAEERAEVLARKFFTGALETISANPDLLGGDDKTSKLVEIVATGLVKDVSRRLSVLDDSDLSLQERAEDWGQIVLRSVLSSAGSTMLASPKLYFGLDDPGKQTLVSSVGTSILGLMLDDGGVDLSRLISRPGLDKIVKAALATVAENPDLMGIDHLGLKRILTQLAKDVADSAKIIGPDILPDVMRLVLEKTARHAELLWPDQFQDPAKHLLVTASKILLQHLAVAPDPGERWRPRLTHAQMLDILEVTLDEVVQNPQWLLARGASSDPILADLLGTVLRVLGQVPAKHLSKETGVAVLKASLAAVAQRKELLGKLAFDGKKRVAIVAVLEMLVAKLLSDEADESVRWTLARGDIFDLVASAALSRVAEVGASAEVLAGLEKLLDEALTALKSKQAWNIEALLTKIKALAA